MICNSLIFAIIIIQHLMFIFNDFNQKVQYEINGLKYETCINLTKNQVVQKNLQTNFERSVRLCVRSLSNNEDTNHKTEDKSECFTLCTWQWLDDSNNWVPYLPAIVIQLESSYEQFINNTNNHLINLVVQTNSYTIDLKNMNQINTKTGFMRKVKRVVAYGKFSKNCPVLNLNQSKILKYLDVTNTKENQDDENMNDNKASSDLPTEDRPSSNLRKRKSTATNNLAIHTSTISDKKVDIESEEIENKKPKRKASINKANSNKQNESDGGDSYARLKLELKQEPNEEQEESSIKTRSKRTTKMNIKYEEGEEEEEEKIEEKIEVKEEIEQEQSTYAL
jgi:hypothetical protein